MSKQVVVGMSGGVDSAVSALLLKEAGFDVVGLYMSNWKETDGSGCCTGEQDYYDVKRVCADIDIPYYSVDFSQQYMEKVFKLFVDEYKIGRTPNPDVLCNREIKFDSFKQFAKEIGADYIATGHYARLEEKDGRNFLVRAADENKDQTYFLNQLTSEQLQNVLFPVGGMVKNEVRDYAVKHNLAVAKKKDSTGICFIGERKFREFLSQYIPMRDGDIITQDGTVVGHHKGVFYYTIGQRRGLGIGGSPNGGAWFVLAKNVEKNLLIVSQGEDDILFSNQLVAEGFNFIPNVPEEINFDCYARIRHRQPLQKVKASILQNGNKVETVHLDFEQPQRAIAGGQYAVLYTDKYCLGGGVIK
ncbi:MAG: tRNA 2-thiouridine(34) synthase MnmA [Clostridia bacterium]|nr:tRNA 2-thiouridine(34) synthase MnmA [Clostridia bacterium]